MAAILSQRLSSKESSASRASHVVERILSHAGFKRLRSDGVQFRYRPII
jgi:hypothetical protein